MILDLSLFFFTIYKGWRYFKLFHILLKRPDSRSGKFSELGIPSFSFPPLFQIMNKLGDRARSKLSGNNSHDFTSTIQKT